MEKIERPSPATSIAWSSSAANRYGPLRVAVCDTDYLMNQVRDAVDPARDLFAGPPGTRERAFAAEHVFDELYRDDGHGHESKWHKLSEQSADSERPLGPGIFQQAFESRYLPYLTFVDMGEMFQDHPLVARVRMSRGGRGASDAPTAQLAVLLSRMRPVGYSHDQHLYKSGVAPRPSLLVSAHAADRQVSKGEYFQEGTTYVAIRSIAGLDLLARRIGLMLGLPVWLSRVLLIGGGIWALADAKRRQPVGRFLGTLLEVVVEQTREIQEGLTTLAAVAVDVEPDESIEARIAEVLVERAADGPLCAEDIQAALASNTARVNVPTVRDLRTLLTAATCFEEGPRWRFRLGHRYSSGLTNNQELAVGVSDQ